MGVKSINITINGLCSINLSFFNSFIVEVEGLIVECKGKMVDSRSKASSRRNSSMVEWMTGLKLVFGWRFHLIWLLGVLSACFYRLFFRNFSYTRGMTVFSNSINKYFGPPANAFHAKFMWALNTSICHFFIANAAFYYFPLIILQGLGTFFDHGCCFDRLNNIRNVYYWFWFRYEELICTKFYYLFCIEFMSQCFYSYWLIES